MSQYLEVKLFKTDTPASIMVAMRRNDWETSINLKDVYFHVLVAKRSWKYLRFVNDGILYQFRDSRLGF